MGMTPAQYEQSIAREILLTKTRALIGSLTPVTRDDARETFIRQSIKLDADFIALKNSTYLDEINPDDAETVAYYDEHKAEFKVGDQFKLDYIQIDTTALEASVDVTDDDIDDYYSENADRYKQPEQVKASHILIKVESGSSEEIWTAALNKANEIKKRLDAGESFEKLATEFSDDTSAANGGDLGYFSKGQMVKPFEDTAWALENEQISEPVKSNFGYHIIKKFDHKTASYKPLEEVRASIVTAIKRDAAKELALEKAREVSTDETKKLSDIASENNLEIKTTELFEKNQPPREIGRGRNFDEVFNLEPGAVSPPIETNRGIFLFSLNQKIDSHIPEFDAVKEKVTTKVKQIKAGTMAKQKAEELYRELQSGGDFAKVAEKHGLKVETTGEFAPGAFIPKVGSDETISDDLFAMNPGDLSEVKVFNDKCVIFKVKSSKAFDETQFNAEIPSLNAKLLSSKQQQTVNSYVQNLKEKMKKEGLLTVEAIDTPEE